MIKSCTTYEWVVLFARETCASCVTWVSYLPHASHVIWVSCNTWVSPVPHMNELCYISDRYAWAVFHEWVPGASVRIRARAHKLFTDCVAQLDTNNKNPPAHTMWRPLNLRTLVTPQTKCARGCLLLSHVRRAFWRCLLFDTLKLNVTMPT